jgi:hypothetical protein
MDHEKRKLSPIERTEFKEFKLKLMLFGFTVKPHKTHELYVVYDVHTVVVTSSGRAVALLNNKGKNELFGHPCPELYDEIIKILTEAL